jgi:outer membrane protein assembly factor BamA
LLKAEQEVAVLRERIKELEQRGARPEEKPEVATAPMRVGQIVIRGNEKTKSSTVLKKAALVPGQVIDLDALRAAEKRLANLHGKVEILSPSDGQGFVDIQITVKE